jgi:fumarate hydratase subunit beta
LGQVIYYVGPTPAPPGRVIGAAGPTTSGRLDNLTIPLLDLGVKALIGKGARSKEVKKALVRNKAVYLAAVGGAGAFYGRLVRRVEVIAWPELGPEALMRLWVENFTSIVAVDLEGSDLYETGPAEWKKNRGSSMGEPKKSSFISKSGYTPNGLDD